MLNVAVLDDYQNVAAGFANLGQLSSEATDTVFNDHIHDSDSLVNRLEWSSLPDS